MPRIKLSKSVVFFEYLDEAGALLLSRACGEHERSRGVYGSPRIHAQLCKRQIHVNVKTVAHIINDANIRAKTVKKWHLRTTQSNHTIAPAANVIERNFAASGPNEKWLCDITYIATEEGFLYLAGIDGCMESKSLG